MKKKILNQSGQGMTEYIAILTLISLSAVAMTTKLGDKIRGRLKYAVERVDTKIKFQD